jgi:hypothetical protein
MAAKRVRLIVRLALLAILAVALAILVARHMASSTVAIENASGAELTDVELRFMVAGTPVPHKIGQLAPGEKRTVTLDFGSGDFSFAATYRMGPLKMNFDRGLSTKGRGQHLVLRISEDECEVVQE